MSFRKLGVIGVVVALVMAFGAYAAQADVTSITSADGLVANDGVETEAVTVVAQDDDGDLVIDVNGTGLLAIVSCAVSGFIPGECTEGNEAVGSGTNTITIDTPDLDVGAVVESLTVVVNLTCTSPVGTTLTVTATQDGTSENTLVTCGALGANTASGDVCDIEGPMPPEIGPGADDVGPGPWDNEFLLEGRTYRFYIVVENYSEAGADPGFEYFNLGVEVDDETGDADITAHRTFGGGSNSVPSVDTLAGGVAAEDVHVPEDAAACEVGTIAAAWIDVRCDRHGRFEITGFEAAHVSNSVTEEYVCLDDPSAMTLTASPATVESHPALGNVSHSLIVAVITDGDGDYVGENYEVDWTTTGCKIDAISEIEYESLYKRLFSAFDMSQPSTAAAINAFLAAGITSHPAGSGSSSDDVTFLHDGSPAPGYQPQTRAAAILHCEGADPGPVTVTAQIEDDQFGQRDDQDITATTEVNVVGPPAFITMVAEPTELVCGEKSQILVTVTDALNQNVSDHTRVELITNYGGVLGGTGSSLAAPGINPVNPLSSSAAETFGGVATGFLLTSTNHIGSYEVVAASGGSSLGAYVVNVGHGLWEDVEEFFNNEELAEEGNGSEEYSESDREELFEAIEELFPNTSGDQESFNFHGNTGVFSTNVITGQVTVNCTEAAPPEVVAPDTGTGTISPPNTGDAGLATRSASTATLFVIAGAAAFIVAGFAGFGFARR